MGFPETLQQAPWFWMMVAAPFVGVAVLNFLIRRQKRFRNENAMAPVIFTLPPGVDIDSVKIVVSEGGGGGGGGGGGADQQTGTEK